VSDGLVNSNYKNFGPRIGLLLSAHRYRQDCCARRLWHLLDRPNMRLYNSQLFNMPYEMIATALATSNENPFVQVPLPSAFPLSLSNTSIFPFGGYPAVLPVTAYGSTTPTPTIVPATGLYPDIHDWSIPYTHKHST